jgi:hypothetical protein
MWKVGWHPERLCAFGKCNANKKIAMFGAKVLGKSMGTAME